MLGEKIRNLRKENKISQEELAEKLDVSRQSISLWENDQTMPSLENIVSLANIFNVSTDVLLKGKVESESKERIPQAVVSVEKTPKEPKQEFKYPSGTKSAIIIGILLFIILCQPIGTYAENPELFDYAVIFGIIDFCFGCLATTLAPMLIGTIKKNLPPKNIKIICLINSIAVYGVSLVLYVCKVIPTMFIGWMVAIFYYFINKHILLQLKIHSCDKKKSLITILIISAVLTSICVGGFLSSKNLLRDKSSNQYTNITSSQSGNYYMDITGEMYDLTDWDECVIVRTISFEDKFTAEYIFAKMESADFAEEEIIKIMDNYGKEQGGGRGHLIERGMFVEEVDEWCFSTDRVEGDVAIIENAYGYSICYLSKMFK